MKQRQVSKDLAPQAGRDDPGLAGPVAASNEVAMSEVAPQEPTPSLLSAVPGGESLHAGTCGCASCLGGGAGPRHPDFTEVLVDGTVLQNDQPAPGAEVPGVGDSDQQAPELGGDGEGEGETLSAGAWTYAKHPAFPAKFGDTFYSEPGLPQAPSVSWQIADNHWPGEPDYTVTLKTTTTAEPSWPVIATPENNEGYLVGTAQEEYPDFDHYVIVGGTAATNIKRAEDQHVQDLDLGWNLVANKLADNINAAAGGDGWTADNPRDAQREGAAQIVAGLGKYGEGIKDNVTDGGSMSGPVAYSMNKAYGASKSKRDHSGKHTWDLELYTAHHDTRRVASMVDEDKALDETASSDIINYGTIG